MKHLLWLTISLVTCIEFATAGSIPSAGDFYFISRDRHGDFLGSHKLYVERSSGLTMVKYCDRPYFVRTNTVAWTQLEFDRGHTVQIEYNFGKGWRPVCRRPHEEVSLIDLGIFMSPEELVARYEETYDRKNRLSTIARCSGLTC
ncbi:MAG: hypothetical protein ABJJ37_04005 [Roseibium sp.]